MCWIFLFTHAGQEGVRPLARRGRTHVWEPRFMLRLALIVTQELLKNFLEKPRQNQQYLELKNFLIKRN